MKAFLLLAISLSAFSAQANYSYNQILEKAPMEWLIAETLKEKIDNHGHLTTDKLTNLIFSNIDYDQEKDELVLKKHKTFILRGELKKFLRERTKAFYKRIPAQKKYLNWKSERTTPYKVILYKTSKKIPGHYFYNHVHTKNSKDNRELKWFKISPQRTFNYVERFTKNRNTKGTIALTDHNEDKAFYQVTRKESSPLNSLRSVEWGGATHMNLIGIKKDWDLVTKGREFAEKESIKKSKLSEGFRILNHPAKKKTFSHTLWGDVDGIEVWNTILESAPYSRLGVKKSNNEKALNEWAKALKAGQKHTAVAGSDFHFIIPCLRDRALHFPLNFIPNPDNTQTKALLKKGNTSILTAPGAPKLTLQAKFLTAPNWSNMGDHLQGLGRLQVQLYGDFSDTNKIVGGVCYNTIRSFYRLFTFWKKRFWEIRFYNKAGEVIAKRSIRPKWYNYKKHFKAVIDMNVKSTDLVRAELWEINRKSQSVDVLGITNPIYLN